MNNTIGTVCALCCLMKIKIMSGELLDRTIYTTPTMFVRGGFFMLLWTPWFFQAFAFARYVKKTVSQNFNVILSEAKHHFIFIKIVHFLACFV